MTDELHIFRYWTKNPVDARIAAYINAHLLFLLNVFNQLRNNEILI